jgi:hypothetical protein
VELEPLWEFPKEPCELCEPWLLVLPEPYAPLLGVPRLPEPLMPD